VWAVTARAILAVIADRPSPIAHRPSPIASKRKFGSTNSNHPPFGGTFSVSCSGMRIKLLLAGAVVAVVAGCNVAEPPTIAGLFGPSSINGLRAPQLVVSPTDIAMVVGQEAQISTNAPDSLLSQLIWTSRNPTIVSVSQTGIVRALATGSASIVVQYSFEPLNSASATIVVNQQPVP